MTVYAVIAVHNNIEYTKRCMRHLARQGYGDVRVVVVDDGSRDGTALTIRQLYPKVTVLPGDGNLWWAGAMNKGIQYVLDRCGRDDFVLSLNNDVDFNENYVSSLVQTSLQYGRAIVGSLGRVKNNGAKIVQGQRFDWQRARWYRSIEELRGANDVTTLSRLDCLDGRGLLIPVEVFGRIGLFRANELPHYMADKEFTYRAKQAGFTLRLALEAKVDVYVSAETTGVHYSESAAVSMGQAWYILTSRRSTNQLRKGWRFIDLCCPAKYRWRNKLMYAKLALARSVGRTHARQALRRLLRA